jgi:hypothetical protein
VFNKAINNSFYGMIELIVGCRAHYTSFPVQFPLINVVHAIDGARTYPKLGQKALTGGVNDEPGQHSGRIYLQKALEPFRTVINIDPIG